MTATAQTLVGRDQELIRLTQLLDGAREGTPAFAELTGEAGIGKTSLLDALARHADAEGFLVLSGRCSEFEQELPFALVIDAFDGYLASMNPQDFERIASEELAELAGLFPSLRSLAPESADPTTPGERFRAHRAMVALIERLAARQPLLLLLDDLHWADGASIEQAAYVLRRPPEAAVMLVGSYRAGQADPGLVGAIQAAAQAGAVQQIRLGPLDRTEARTLVGGDSDHVYEQSGGNPFYMLQLARSEAEGNRRITDARGVPTAVTASIASELESLGSSARALADAGAVAGDPFDLDLAATTADLEERTALEAIDQLIARDLIRPTSIPRRFQFRHPLVRTAVYERCPAGARLAAHERASEVLAARGAPAAERAHHAEHAARHGDTGAIEVLREAGNEAVGRAPLSAARWFAAALRLLPAGADPEERLGLLMSLGGAQAATGLLEESRETLAEAVELATDDGAVPKVAVIAACAGVEQLLGHPDQAHRRLTEAFAELPDRRSPAAVNLLIQLSLDAFYSGRWDEMSRYAIEGLETARELGDRPLTAAAGALAAFATSCIGPVDEARRYHDEAAALVDAQPDEELATRLDAVAWLSASAFYLDLYEDGIAHGRRGLALARATGQGDLIPALVQALANMLFTTGRVTEANELLDGSVESARLSRNALGLAWSLMNRGYSALIEGDLKTATATSAEALELTRAFEGSVSAWAGAVAAGIAVEEGRVEEALAIMDERCGGIEADLIEGGWKSNMLAWATRALLLLDRQEEAERIATLAEERARDFPLPLARGGAAEARARVALAAGDPAGAAESAMSGAEIAAGNGVWVQEASCRMLAGQAFAEAGEAEKAIEQLERAAEMYEASGAERYRNLAERELGKLGRRTHRRTKGAQAETGVASLTGRELEIANLVVDRRTNPEIAAELFLSVKTVETHMRNIFRKLDASSRVEVARIVESSDT